MPAGSSTRAPGRASTTSCTLYRSVAGSVTSFAPGSSRNLPQAVNRTGRPASTSGYVPVTRVGTASPLTLISGPWPQPSRSGRAGGRAAGTPGMVTSVIWSGPCNGVNLIASRRVRIGANRTTPDGPTLPPRTWPPEPAISTCSRPWSSGVRCTVIRCTAIRCRQPTVSTGCASVVLAIQVVAGLPSTAARAWSRGSAV